MRTGFITLCMSNFRDVEMTTTSTSAHIVPVLEKTTESMRQLMNMVTKIEDAGALAQIAGGLEQLLEISERYQSKRATANINLEHGDQLANLLPYSPITGPLNPLAPQVIYRREGHKLIADVSFGDLYEGPPHSVHGGVVAGLFDQLLAIANMLNGTAGPTASLTVDYKKPTPLNKPLRFEAWQEHVDGRKVYMKGQAFDGDLLLAESKGLFIHLF